MTVTLSLTFTQTTTKKGSGDGCDNTNDDKVKREPIAKRRRKASQRWVVLLRLKNELHFSVVTSVSDQTIVRWNTHFWSIQIECHLHAVSADFASLASTGIYAITVEKNSNLKSTMQSELKVLLVVSKSESNSMLMRIYVMKHAFCKCGMQSIVFVFRLPSHRLYTLPNKIKRIFTVMLCGRHRTRNWNCDWCYKVCYFSSCYSY